MSELLRKYMRLVARGLIEEWDDVDEEKLTVWNAMSEEDRDRANQLVEDIFEEWL